MDSSQLQAAADLARKWLPPITEEDKITVVQALTGTEISFGTSLLRKYIQLLRPYTQILGISDNELPREADCVASGIVFFYGCFCYIMHFPGWGSHIEDIFLYNLLYILVDHYIDDIRIDPIIKDRAIAQMFVLIHNPLAHETMTLIDPILKTIAVTYHRLITRCPSAKESIIKLFKVEIEGLSIQKTDQLSREKYYDIALRKGGYTMEILRYIVNEIDPTIKNASFHIGTIMQLIDDCLDVDADKGNGIHTIATYDLAHKGCLDDLWVDIIYRINAIDSRFTAFIIFYTIFAMYVPDRIKHAYSDELRKYTNPMNLFDYNYGCDGSSLLVEAISNELLAIDILTGILKEDHADINGIVMQ